MRIRCPIPKPIITYLLVLSACCLQSCSEKPQEAATVQVVRPVKLLTIGGASASQARKLPGTVQATDRVDLAFQVAGTLINIPVKEGQRVKKGDLLAKLDPRDFETSVNNAKGSLAKAKASVEYAAVEYQRYRNIKTTDAGAVSDSMVLLKQKSLKVARADLQSAEAGIAAAQDQLAYTQLYAPFAGVIAQKYVDNYQEIKAKEAILSLQNMSNVDVVVDIPEMLMTPIRKSPPLMFAEFASDPNRRFELKIKEVALQADPKTQTYRLVLTMPAPTGIRILSGMTATVNIDLAEAISEPSTNIVIPLIAVWADEAGKAMVWTVDTKTMSVHKTPVTTGELSGSENVRVTTGLKMGDMIAISGVSKLHEAQVVRDIVK
jgi:membrane fusion protein, multidrug efflux system